MTKSVHLLFAITATCTTVEVAGAEGDLSGTYIYDGSGTYIRRGGFTSYVLGKYDSDQWRLGQGFSLYYALSNYPHYYVSIPLERECVINSCRYISVLARIMAVRCSTSAQRPRTSS